MKKDKLFERSEFLSFSRQAAIFSSVSYSLDFFVTFCVKTKRKGDAIAGVLETGGGGQTPGGDLTTIKPYGPVKGPGVSTPITGVNLPWATATAVKPAKEPSVFAPGKKQYEFSNHLGNVLVTVSDMPLGVDENNDYIADYYMPNVLTVNDYEPFGAPLEGRTEVEASGYRFGFNGQERVDEVYGDGNSYTAEFWQYDPRIARRWNLDPIPQIGISDYACFANNPIFNVDIKGDKVDPSDLKKNDEQTYNDVKSDWQKQTGLTLVEKDGMLDYARDEKGKAIFEKDGTSKTARKLLMKAIDSKKTLYLTSGEYTAFLPSGVENDNRDRLQFNRAEILSFARDWQGNEKYRNTVMNFGIVGFHELIHYLRGISDTDNGYDGPKSRLTPGLTIKFENKIRKELGDSYLQRLNYYADGIDGFYVYFDKKLLQSAKKIDRKMKGMFGTMDPGNYIKQDKGKNPILR